MPEIYELPSIVFILGAGASAEGGCPVMSNFFERADQLYDLRQLPRFEEAVIKVRRLRGRLKQAEGAICIDLDNLEAVFNAIEMANTLGAEIIEKDFDVVEHRNALIQVIVETLERTQLYKYKRYLSEEKGIDERGHPQKEWKGTLIAPDGYAEFATFLRKLVERKPEHSISCVTFNYDMGLEVALLLAGLKIDYGLEGVPAAGGAISVYKLHGSVNWFKNLTNGSIQSFEWLPEQWTPERWDVKELNGESKPFVLPSSLKLEDMASNAGCGKEPWIVPPSENKNSRREELKGVWRKASQVLRAADSVVVMGYSMPTTDQFFRQFLALSLISPQVSRGFWVCDPLKQTRRRYEKLLGPHLQRRAMCLPMTFSAAVSHLNAVATRNGGSLWANADKEMEMIRSRAAMQNVRSQLRVGNLSSRKK